MRDAIRWFKCKLKPPKKKGPARKPRFPTKEELPEKKRLEERKNKLAKNSTVCIGENMMAIDRHIDWYTQEVRMLQFFAPDHTLKVCKVIAITDWAMEYNQLSTNPLLEIPEYLESRYFGPQRAQGQILMRPAQAEPGATYKPSVRCYSCTFAPCSNTGRTSWPSWKIAS